MRGDGDGWVVSDTGTPYWGRHGAAGLLLRAPRADGTPAVLLQHRAPWSHQGGTWALPGGARDSHETPEQAAVREAHEEAGLRAEHVAVRATVVTAEVVGTGGAQWSYTTVVADAPELLSTVANRESSELRWVAEDEVIELPLHPGFAASWERLRITTMLSAHEHEECLLAVPHTVEIRAGVFAWCTSAAAEVS
ncbi:NUDIX hydrolase [Mycolicibacterium aichiense]|uniref:NUDIX hydrolase n=1 Tax=Mycolicibacterium aichiense TaxID=1799 RepID=UPI000E1B6ACF|nr:NUDIX hydrolase [Mycolicibacterium aichiense]MCV7017362.1 NUDIX hydrolase [Mycolicibacterium aichiense]